MLGSQHPFTCTSSAVRCAKCARSCFSTSGTRNHNKTKEIAAAHNAHRDKWIQGSQSGSKALKVEYSKSSGITMGTRGPHRDPGLEVEIEKKLARAMTLLTESAGDKFEEECRSKEPWRVS